MKIDDIIQGLANLSREDIREISGEDFLITRLISYDKSELLCFCEKNYHKYIQLRTQMIRIFMFDNYYQNFELALETINDTLQVCYFDKQYDIYVFDLLYMRTLLFHYFHQPEDAYEEARFMYNTQYKQINEANKAKIHKLLAITTYDKEEAVEQSMEALVFFKDKNKTEEGFIYKNLAFWYLELEEFSKSIEYMLKLLDITALMDVFPSADVYYISGYLELLQEIKSISTNTFNGIREYLLNYTNLKVEKSYTVENILKLLIEK